MPEAISPVIGISPLMRWTVERNGLFVLSYNMQISIVVRLWALTLAWVQSIDLALTSYELRQSLNFPVPGSVSVE